MAVPVVGDGDGHRPERLTREPSSVLYEDDQLRIIQVMRPGTVQLDGDVDITNSATVAEVITRVAERCGGVVIDTAGLRFIDISGWRVLTGAGAGRAGARPRLVNIAPCVERLSRRLRAM